MSREDKIASRIVAGITTSVLDGCNRRKASNIVNKLIQKHTRGFFSDVYWTPIQRTFSELDKSGVTYYIKHTEYTKDKTGNPISKEWRVECPFVNDRGRNMVIFVVIVASGAGLVSDPFSRYDVAAYAN